MQEGDVQIKGYPVRLPLDLMLVFTANPEDYTARGKIITPLKDRIGSEIRTHYPATLDHGMAITEQEAWVKRRTPVDVRVPDYIRETIEQLAFSARDDKKVDKRSGVSQRLPISVLENVVSNAERRALAAGETVAVPRVLDVYAALPSITGKLELEYEGELKGGDSVARELIRLSVGKVFTKFYDGDNLNAVVQYFDLGGSLRLDEEFAQLPRHRWPIWGRFKGCSKRPRSSAWARASPTPRELPPPNSSWKACTPTGASAAMRKWVSPPKCAVANRRTILAPRPPNAIISRK